LDVEEKEWDANAERRSQTYTPTPTPRFRLFFKCENFQKIGAFKARGAFHAIARLVEEMGIEEVRRRGVVTHSSGTFLSVFLWWFGASSVGSSVGSFLHGVCGPSFRRFFLLVSMFAPFQACNNPPVPKIGSEWEYSILIYPFHITGNHAQALALAASTFQIPSYIVMPSISTPSKIAGTRLYTSNVIFSGSTSQEREAVVNEVIADKGAILVPPYDHPDIILGQGTVALELEEQVDEILQQQQGKNASGGAALDAVIAPLGGGGLLSGVATWFSDKAGTLVFGVEPSYQGGDDGRRGLAQGRRIEHVKTLTIADGLRTPVGVTNWDVLCDKHKLEGVYAVSEEEIKMAMRLVFERLKVVVEPSGCVGLAVVLFNRQFRALCASRQQMGMREKEEEGWNVGIVFSGGNTTMKAIAKLFGEGNGDGDAGDEGSANAEREAAMVGMDGERRVEDVAG
jgi:threonine dehydratase